MAGIATCNRIPKPRLCCVLRPRERPLREPVFLQRLLDDSGDLMVDVLLDAGPCRSFWIGSTVRQRERQMKVAAVQMSARLADVDHNLERAGALLERAFGQLSLIHI